MSSGSRTHSFLITGVALLLPLTWSMVAPADTAVNGTGFDPRTVPIVGTEDLSIAYQTAGVESGITSVDLWYTLDEGATWRKWQGPPAPSRKARLASADDKGRVEFRAETDGLHGFFLVLHNDAGASSPAPESGMAPQQWIRVDRSPPAVNILSVRKDDRFDITREVEIRWDVRDPNLTDRPVMLHYRTVDTKSFRLVADSQAAQSSYRWTVPPDVGGRVEFKVSAVDLAGHRSQSIADALEIKSEVEAAKSAWYPESPHKGIHSPADELSPQGSLVVTKGILGESVSHSEPDAGVKLIDDKATAKARERYDLGTWHRLRGEYDLALARYREALDESPMYHAARHDLAALLLMRNEIEEAEKELTRLLKEEPEYRAGLRTMALLHTRQKNYKSSADLLERLLLLEPADAEALLYLGDVSLFMGDRPAARESWEKVDAIPTASEPLKRRAKTRLEMYAAEGNQSP